LPRSLVSGIRSPAGVDVLTDYQFNKHVGA
jgi:hypothetical protein